jgi:hypothetical protein
MQADILSACFIYARSSFFIQRASELFSDVEEKSVGLLCCKSILEANDTIVVGNHINAKAGTTKPSVG